MKIALASDHAGYNFKEKLISYLIEKGYIIKDFGCSTQDKCDYPDFGIPAAKSVASGRNERAILICGNGIGMSILANKINGIVAAVVYSVTTAADTRKHHDTKVLCLGAREHSEEKLLKFVDIWLSTEFEAGRHLSRLAKIKMLENK
jgi:ribose 5-phosphate isomerase B